MTLHELPFRGPLLSRSFLESLSHGADLRIVPAHVAAAFAGAWRAMREHSRDGTPRVVTDLFGATVARLLGFTPRAFRPIDCDLALAVLTRDSRAVASMCVTRGRLERARSAIAAATTAAGLRWALAFDGEWLGLIDATRPHARRWIAADVGRCIADSDALNVLVAVFGADALAGGSAGGSAIEAMIAASESALQGVRATLQNGVERATLILTRALSARRSGHSSDVEQLFQEALTVVYRVLFLQFAEARGLVPVWHPTYRRAYTVEALREQLADDGAPPGIWEALQAMTRLAHQGARAGELVVVPFNGRLFSPAHTPLASGGHVPDHDAASAVSALTLLPRGSGRPQRIPFVDLGVEQLGAIYERVLDFTPEYDARARTASLRRGSTRKTTGSFYTPRALTEVVVRRALAPLVDGRSPEEILALKVLDPAMGSGAFLVAACRFLARAYESALLSHGVAGAEDFSPADRAGFKRAVAQHCLFGVDVNPMAVQLGRLSLWLCSLAADKPLTFLDHRLRTGNSLVGASLEIVSRRAPCARRSRIRPTLFAEDALESFGRALELRRLLDSIADEDVEAVRRKEALSALLDSENGPLAGWKTICDAWCAWWFWPGHDAPEPREFAAMCAAARGETAFGHAAIRERLRRAQQVARARRFFHWPLEFPEVLTAPPYGFDAIIGNPPWEMMRGETGTRELLRFTRDSELYRLQSRGHSNACQLFVERALQLVRDGGRIGLILPWSVASDEGSAALRRYLLDRCVLDELPVLDNREGIFPIHRALKFIALCASTGGRTESLRVRAPVTRLSDGDGEVIELSRDLLSRLSGESLAVPHLTSPRDTRVLDVLLSAAPPAASPEGWGLHFGRELNATDDRALLSEYADGYPVIAGRHVHPFQVFTADSRLRISPADAQRTIGAPALRHRLAYRDVSGAGNRTTLIAAIVPPRVVTTHTLFCLKTRLALDEQYFLCGLLNSFVANYIVRTRVASHVTTAIVHALPLPRPARGSHAFERIVALARRLATTAGDSMAQALLQVEVAALYGLDADVLAFILSRFPLIPAAEREAVLDAYGATRAV